MKKRNLKNLVLNKASISNLTGGAETGETTFTGPSITILNSAPVGCWSDGVNSCPSEYRTACEQTVDETCGFHCESIHNPSN